MKDFKHWGIRIRRDKKRNYYSLWYNLKTIRLDLGDTCELLPDRSEFYDVGLGTKCNAECPFCYVSAKGSGEFWANPSEAWNRFISTVPKDTSINSKNLPLDDEVLMELLEPVKSGEDLKIFMLKITAKVAINKNWPVCYTEKPFQVAIGSTMEPTIHPDFCRFLETVYNTDVVPNYTTNGITLSNENSELAQDLLEATRKFCGGVAVSYGNTHLRNKADRAIQNLIDQGECKVMIHHLISDKDSVEALVEAAKNWKGKVHYHVLLPLMEHGRSTQGMKPEIYPYMCERLKEEDISNIALGANFIPSLKRYPKLLNIWEYPQETYSKNILLKDSGIEITPSSYNLNPILIV